MLTQPSACSVAASWELSRAVLEESKTIRAPLCIALISLMSRSSPSHPAAQSRSTTSGDGPREESLNWTGESREAASPVVQSSTSHSACR